MLSRHWRGRFETSNFPEPEEISLAHVCSRCVSGTNASVGVVFQDRHGQVQTKKSDRQADKQTTAALQWLTAQTLVAVLKHKSPQVGKRLLLDDLMPVKFILTSPSTLTQLSCLSQLIAFRLKSTPPKTR